jgi:hypothetical protein
MKMIFKPKGINAVYSGESLQRKEVAENVLGKANDADVCRVEKDPAQEI